MLLKACFSVPFATRVKYGRNVVKTRSRNPGHVGFAPKSKKHLLRALRAMVFPISVEHDARTHDEETLALTLPRFSNCRNLEQHGHLQSAPPRPRRGLRQSRIFGAVDAATQRISRTVRGQGAPDPVSTFTH